jgi:hypothetical protein
MFSGLAHSNSIFDANNEGEAIGIIYSYTQRLEVIKFMCDRKVPEKGALLTEAIDKWIARNIDMLINFNNGLDRIPSSEREKLFELIKKAQHNIIIAFNKLNKQEKEKTCISLAEHLNLDTFRNEFPLAYKFMSE